MNWQHGAGIVSGMSRYRHSFTPVLAVKSGLTGHRNRKCTPERSLTP